MSAVDASGKIRVGCSGWSYRDWVGPFYPKGLSASDYLSHYATEFSVVEVDSTYYAIPRESTIEGWAERTPEEFRFLPEMPRTITHGTDSERPNLDRVLRDDTGQLEKFIEALEPLGQKLGPLIFQFPYFRVKEMAVADFLERLARVLEQFPKSHRAAVELRNKNWINAKFFEILNRFDVAPVMIDHPYMLPPTQQLQLGMVASDFSIIRLLGDRYAIERKTKKWGETVLEKGRDLQEWADVIQEMVDRPGVREVYTFSNNHYAGHAPATCRELLERLS